MNTKTLIITALHGDETFSSEVMDQIAQKYDPDTYNYQHVIGNPRAVESNTRFTEADLNRVAPGDLESTVYEERRAAELVAMSKDFDCVIDVHGTKAKSGIFILVTNPTIENFLVAAAIDVPNVVIWAAKSSRVKGPVTQYTQCPAIEIECGPKDSPEIAKKLQSILEEYFAGSHDLSSLLSEARNKSYYIVEGMISGLDTSNLKEFEPFSYENETVYPLLINSYEQGSVRKMRKVDFFELMSY